MLRVRMRVALVDQTELGESLSAQTEGEDLDDEGEVEGDQADAERVRVF